jgi:hypothetical protein
MERGMQREERDATLEIDSHLIYRTTHYYGGFQLPVMKEYEEFAMRGNMLDHATGIIIGGAFGKVVSSCVCEQHGSL